jgi:hypothetical protein
MCSACSRADSGRTTRGVSREATIAHNVVVLTGELGHDVESHIAAAADAAHISLAGPGRGVLVDIVIVAS